MLAVPRDELSPGSRIEVAKRLFDVTAAGLALLALLPLFALIALAIRLDSPGPVFYVARRMGGGRRVFSFLKFRSMRVGSDCGRAVTGENRYDGVFVKYVRDPRVTPVGRWLRRTSLDELPQLVNVLRGDMSLVGNRPLPLGEAEEIIGRGWEARFEAPSGLTGLWQVERTGRPIGAMERVALDLRYARERNFLGDLVILWRTPAALWQED